MDTFDEKKSSKEAIRFCNGLIYSKLKKKVKLFWP
jgi:hypothetical protein